MPYCLFRPPVSGARHYGHPGFPLFLRPPGARSLFQRSKKNDGAQWAPSCFLTRYAKGPLPSYLSARKRSVCP